MRWKICNEARSTELAVNIPYLTSASGNFFFIKNANNIWRILSAIICKNNRFSVCFYFEQRRTVTIFGEHGIMAAEMAHIP